MRAFLSTFFVIFSISLGGLEEAFASSLDDDSDFSLSSVEKSKPISSKRKNEDGDNISDSEEFSRENRPSKKRNLKQNDEKKNKTKKVKNNKKTNNSKKISNENSENIIRAKNGWVISEKSLKIFNNIVEITKICGKIYVTDLQSIIIDGKVKNDLEKLENIAGYKILGVPKHRINTIIASMRDEGSCYYAFTQENKINILKEGSKILLKYNENDENVNLSINDKDVDNIPQKPKNLQTHEFEKKETETERGMFLKSVENYFISTHKKKMKIKNFVKNFSTTQQQARFRSFVHKLEKSDSRFELKSEGRAGILVLYFKNNDNDSTKNENDKQTPNVMAEYIDEDETEEKPLSCSNSHNNITIFNIPSEKNEINNNLNHDSWKIPRNQNRYTQPSYNPMNHLHNFNNMQPFNNQNRSHQPISRPLNFPYNINSLLSHNNQNRPGQPDYNPCNHPSPSNNIQFYNNQGEYTQSSSTLGFNYHNLNYINNNPHNNEVNNINLLQNNTNREVPQNNVGDKDSSLSSHKETSSIFNPSSSQASISLHSSNEEIIPVEKEDSPPIFTEDNIPVEKEDSPPIFTEDNIPVEKNNSPQQSTLTWKDIVEKRAQGWKLKDEKDRTGESLLKKYKEILDEIASEISKDTNANTEKDFPKLKKLEENLAKLEMRLPHHFDKVEEEKHKATFIDLVEEE